MDQKTRNKLNAHLAGVAFSIMVGFSFVSVKICIPLATPWQILSYRYNFAFITAVLFVLVGIYKVSFKKKPKALLGIVIFGYVGFMVFQVLGLVFTSSVNGAILFAIIPVFAKLIARLVLGERSTVLQDVFMWISISALLVMILMGAKDLSFSFKGVACLIIASGLMAVSNVFMRQIKNQFTPKEITFSISLSGFLFFNTVTLISAVFNNKLGDYFNLMGNLKFMLATAYLGIFCILFSSQLMSYMLARMTVVQGSLYGNVSTAISVIAGTVILSEPLMPYHIVCTVLIIIGVVGISFFSNAKALEVSSTPQKTGDSNEQSKKRRI